jgi:hypothetical protein
MESIALSRRTPISERFAAWCSACQRASGGTQNTDADVLVGVLWVCFGVGGEDRPPRLERARDVLEEDQAKHDVLVLSGVHMAAELVGSGPEGRLEAKWAAVRNRVPLGHDG